MKRLTTILFCALACFVFTANARVEVNFDFFYDNLAPYGEWASVPDYGYVWHPADVDDDWTPYSDGYWAYTDAGWTWVSYEEWGGIPYHYGRWAQFQDYGWCWVPDYEWGPAWVSWRQSDDYVGWAPLPPEARWRRGTGFGIWVDTEYDIGPAWFHFCHVRDFGAPFLRPVILPRARNVTFIEQTINITNITYRNDRGYAFNGGPDYRRVSALSARPLPALKLVRNTEDIFTHGSRGNVFRNAPRGNTLVVAAPPVAARTPGAPAKQPPVARSFTTAKIDRGWSGPAGDPSHDRVRSHFKKETEGASPQTAPARAFQPGLVAVVPKKADPKARVVSDSAVAGGRGGKPVSATPGTSPAPAVTPQPAVPPVISGRRPGGSKPGEPSGVPPAIVSEPGGGRFGNKPSRIVETPKPAPVVPPNAPAIAPAPAVVPSAPVVKTSPAAPAIATEPRGESFRKKPSKTVESPQPAPRVPAPTSPPAPQPVQPKNDGAARIAREQADSLRRQQKALDDKRKQEAAAAGAVQRRQDELNARRAAEEGRARQSEMRRQQQAPAAAEAPRRQAPVPKAPAPAEAPPAQRAPVQAPPPQARRGPAANPAPATPADPRRHKGKDEDDKKK